MADVPRARPARVFGLGPVASAMLALPVLWLVAMYAFDLPERVRFAIGNWSIVVPAALAAMFAARSARIAHLDPQLRRGWALIAFALAIDAFGFGAFGWYEVVYGVDPTYGWVNLPFYLYFIAMFFGLVLLTPPSQTALERPLYALDVLAVGLAGAMLLAEFVVHPLLDDASLAHDLPQALTLTAYPLLGALTLFGVASLLMRLPEGGERRPFQLLCLAVGVNLIADSAWSVLALLDDYDTGDLSDFGWLVGACLFLAATELAWREQKSPGFRRGTYLSRDFTRLMPYLAIATGMCALLAGILAEASDLVPLALFGIVLSGVVFWRQWLSARSQQDRALADTRDLAERRLAALVERSADVIFVLGNDLNVCYASPGAARLFGVGAATHGSALIDAVHPADQARVRGVLDTILHNVGSAPVLAEWRFARPDGEWLACENTLSNQFDDDAVRGIVINVRDVSERHELQERLRYQALHDPLTGVANRALFIDRLMQALVRRKRQGGSVAVLFIDLDHFKLINDSLGHIAGDHLLRLVGQRLLDTVRLVDTVARFGGDEFAVLLEDAGVQNEVIGVAGRTLYAMSTPLPVDGRPTVVGASIGVAFARDEDTAEMLMRNADLAVYKAKSGGRGRVAVYEPELQQAVGTRLELHQALRRALAADAFELHYQPIVALDEGSVIGVEALLRWSVDGQPLAANEIVAAAEEAGLIDTLGRQVLVRALADARRLVAELDVPTLLLTVNVSVHQLEHADFVRDIAAMLAANNWPAERLVLEFDERINQRRSEVLRPVLMQLKDLGVRLSIDNFGIGESALTLIERLPFDTLKISRHFVARLGAPNEKAARALAEALVGLGRALAMTTIGHGVENARQSETLGAIGCRYAQGFHLARPMPVADLLAWLRAGGGRH